MSKKLVALYCRVSTSDKNQSTENQIRELKSYCERMDYEIVKIYEDEVSGAKSREKRPAYNALCKDAFRKNFELIIGWDVSRFGRSMKEFVSFLADMDDKGIGVIAVKNGLDTVSSSGRMMMKLIGVLEGSSVPDIYIPRLIELYRTGRFPIDRLITTYPFAEINRAVADSHAGTVVKPVLLMPTAS